MRTVSRPPARPLTFPLLSLTPRPSLRATPQGRLTLASVGKRSTVACAAVALLPGAMSFLRAAGLSGGAGSSFGGGGLRNSARGFYANAASTGGNLQTRYGAEPTL